MNYTIELSGLEFLDKKEIINTLDDITDSGLNESAITGYALDTDINSIKDTTNYNKENTFNALTTIFPKLMSDEEETILLDALNKVEENDIEFNIVDYDSNVEMVVGKTYQLSLSGNNRILKNIYANWSSSDNSILTVENGLVSAILSGSATISATYKLGYDITSCRSFTITQS